MRFKSEKGRLPFGNEWICPYTPDHLRKLADMVTRQRLHGMLPSQEEGYKIIRVNYDDNGGEPCNVDQKLNFPYNHGGFEWFRNQGKRGLPKEWDDNRFNNDYHFKCSLAIWDYDTMPAIVVTNGEDDWPMSGGFRMDFA